MGRFKLSWRGRLSPVGRDILKTRAVLIEGINSIDGLEIYGEPEIGIFTFGFKDFDIFAVADGMDNLGWVTNRCTEPPAIHLLLTPNHLYTVSDYLGDLGSIVSRVKHEKTISQSPRATY